MSDDLTAFLRARLDEDFEAVRVVLGVNVMAGIRRGESAPRWVPSPEGDAGVRDTNGVPRVKFAWSRERDHIIRHDPARVLRGIAAKRAAVDEAAYWFDKVSANEPHPMPGLADRAVVARSILCALAAEWSDHPDHDPGWIGSA